MNKKRVALIGLGEQSQNDHIPGILNSQNVNLVAICDVNQKILNTYKKKLSVKGYVNYEELFKNEKLDFVIIAVPHHNYGSIVKLAIKSGVHILKEKPFALSVKEAKNLNNLCQKNNIHMMVAMQRRFNPIYHNFFQFVEKIGHIFSIDIHYNLFIKEPHVGWRGNAIKAGGGCIIDMGYHMIDLILWYFDLPDFVHADISAHAVPNKNYDAEDTAQILFSYGDNIKNKINGTLILSRSQPPKKEEIKVYGSDGFMVLEKNFIKRFDLNGKLVESLNRDFFCSSNSTNQIDYFCQILDGVKHNHSSTTFHLKHMAFVEACYESFKKGKYVKPNLFLQNTKKGVLYYDKKVYLAQN